MKKKRFRQNKNNNKNNNNRNQNNNNNNKKKERLYDDIIVLKRKTSPKKKKTPEEPIQKIEFPKYMCSKCNTEIKEISSALGDKETGEPTHFKCVFEFLKNSEEIKDKEELIYIGHGNFAIVNIPNPKNRKEFKIIKLIEWENKNKEYPWKRELAELASKTWENPFIGCEPKTTSDDEDA